MKEIEEIYPKVVVYRNALKDTKQFLSTILNESPYAEKWSSWYTMGKQTSVNEYGYFFGNTFPDYSQWAESRDTNENYVSAAIANAFYSSTKDYVERYQIKLPNWSHGIPTINSHTAQKADGKLAMQHHTDSIMSQSEWPGYKHWITCNIYINDNYEGGGLSFKVFRTETEYDKFSYKPQAGDSLVFPSHHPYYHGVKKTLSGEKFFIRTFWGYEYEGSEEYRLNHQLFGQDWLKAEEKRSKNENASGKWMKGHLEES